MVGCPIRPDCSCIDLSYPCDPCKSAVAFVLLDLPLALFIHRHAQSRSHIDTPQVTFVPPEARISLRATRCLLYTFTEDRGIPVLCRKLNRPAFLLAVAIRGPETVAGS